MKAALNICTQFTALEICCGQRLSEMSYPAPGAKPLKQAALRIVVCANLNMNSGNTAV